MKMENKYLISNLEELRQVIPSPKPVALQKVTTELDEDSIAFIAESPLVFVATTSMQSQLDVSPKGDNPGFVQVKNPRTLLLPERPGNRLTFGFQNILETGTIGLIFVVPGVTETLRISGTAKLSRHPDLLVSLASNDKPALLITEIAISECFFHCAKAFIRSKTWEPTSWRASAAKDAAVQNWSRLFSIDKSAIKKVLADDYRNNL